MKKRKLTKEEILHLAKLSSLKLTEKEIEKYFKQLEETIIYVENLKDLNTKGTSTTSQTTNISDVYFDDGEKNSRGLESVEAIKNAKNKKNNFFVVKRIL